MHSLGRACTNPRTIQEVLQRNTNDHHRCSFQSGPRGQNYWTHIATSAPAKPNTRMPEAIVATKSTDQGLSTTADQIEMSGAGFVPICPNAHGSRLSSPVLKAALCWRLQFASEPARDLKRFHRVSKLGHALTNVFTSRAFERANVRAKSCRRAVGRHWSYLPCGAARLADDHNARLIRRERYRTLSHRSMPLLGGDGRTRRSFRTAANLINIKLPTPCLKRVCTLKATNDLSEERRRPARADRLIFLADLTAIKLPLLANFLGAVRLAGRIERFPPGLLPGSASVTQVDGRLVQYCVEPGRGPCRPLVQTPACPRDGRPRRTSEPPQTKRQLP